MRIPTSINHFLLCFGLLTAAISPCNTLMAADVKEGQEAYSKVCKSCHGADGVANPAMEKLSKVTMRSLASAEVQALPDARLAEIITAGIGKMRPVASLTPAQAQSVVAYIRTWKK